jgi:hypothetical protein
MPVASRPFRQARLRQTPLPPRKRTAQSRVHELIRVFSLDEQTKPLTQPAQQLPPSCSVEAAVHLGARHPL